MSVGTRELLASRREQLLGVARRHRATNLRVFGSVVRGEDRPDSDIDFLVEFDSNATLFDLIALKDELQALLGREADVVTSDSVSPFMRERILAEAQPL